MYFIFRRGTARRAPTITIKGHSTLCPYTCVITPWLVFVDIIMKDLVPMPSAVEKDRGIKDGVDFGAKARDLLKQKLSFQAPHAPLTKSSTAQDLKKMALLG
jgi:hypothetical protein